MHCTLFIPNFLLEESPSSENRLAAAETLIARGRRKRKASISREAWLCERFDAPKQRDWPVAPYTLLADGEIPGGVFGRAADPVQLSAPRDSRGFDGAALELSRSGADALTGPLNRHFGETLVFRPLRPERWYLSLPEAPELATTPPWAARGT